MIPSNRVPTSSMPPAVDSSESGHPRSPLRRPSLRTGGNVEPARPTNHVIEID
jgi:hypothetical protein